ncbi:hypothetical protein P4O66_019306 [Electrophorus voltai]|uniref:Anterior gradient 1 n=1 Tax=Electrophorus voltai TaxID=2609070 RepID=A0AAD8ZTG7_9TELE|nr:hypothetical protein P4O66_019306 [Electrophorus voltai]
MTRQLLTIFLVLVTLSSTMGKTEKQAAVKKEKRVPQTLSRVVLFCTISLGGWGDQLIWAQTYEEALFWARSHCFMYPECKERFLINKTTSTGTSLLWSSSTWMTAHTASSSSSNFRKANICSFTALKKAFAEDKEIQKLADEDFILLNLVYETTDKHLSPDGQYVPRILFVDPSMTVRADITGRYSNRMYAYEPSDLKLMLSNMQRAKKFLKTEL